MAMAITRTTFTVENHPFRRSTNELTQKDAARFWSKVAILESDECWEWQACKTKKGYGHFGIGRMLVRAHRVAWALVCGNGDFPIEHVLHRCDNPPCCNPRHLFLGSSADNTADMLRKGRGKSPPRMIGEAHVEARLTEAQVVTMRFRRAAGETTLALAREFRVSHSLVSTICIGKTWKHAGGPRVLSQRGNEK